MRIKIVLLMFSMLFVIGMTNTWADGPAGPIGPDRDGPAGAVGGHMEAVYEVTMPAEMASQLPDEFSREALQVMLEMGWLRLESFGSLMKVLRHLGLVDGDWCHLVVSSCGQNCWYTFCRPGHGSVRCACSWGVDPATE